MIVAGMICYSNSFVAPFLLDDLGAIVDNASIRDLSNIGTVLTGATHATVIGRPLLNLSLAINYALSGTGSNVDYHAFNLAFHLIAALVLFGIIRRTLLLPTIPASVRRNSLGLAFAATLIWAVHPLQTESVTYIVQRAESMVAIFYFLSLYCVIRGATAEKPVRWYVGSVVACALGVATKEVIVTAPLVILFYDRIFLGRSFGEIRKRRTGLYAGLFANWGWLVILMRSSQGRSNTAGFGLGMSSWDYAMTQFGFIVRYLRLCFWPNPLVFDYGDPIARTPMEIIPYAVIILVLLIAVTVSLYVRPWIGFLGLSFFLILSPTSSIVPLVTQTAAEHRMYLPLSTVVVLFVILGNGVLDWLAARQTLHPAATSSGVTIMKWAALILIGLGLGYLTFQRNADYRSEMTLWEKNARDYPTNARAFTAIGQEYIKTGQFGKAIEQFNRAAQLRNDVFQIFYNRGNAYVLSGQFELAEADFQRATELVPEDSTSRAQAFYQKGYALGFAGKQAEALKCFQRTLEIQPDHADAQTMVDKLNRLLNPVRDTTVR